MVPMGCDYTYQNAAYNFHNMNALMKFVEKEYTDLNLKFRYSTPTEYTKAVLQENDEIPIYSSDLFPYTDGAGNEVWTGFYSSRPAYKKAIKHGSALFHAQNKEFAKEVLKQSVSNDTVAEIMKAKNKGLDALGIMQDHNSITGDNRQHVVNDNLMRLSKALDFGQNLVNKNVATQLSEDLGLKIEAKDLSQCLNGPSGGNDTVKQCPIYQHSQLSKDKEEFLVVVSSSQNLQNKESYARVRLPSKNYKAQKWTKKANSTDLAFIDVPSDILEQVHFNYDKKKETDFEMIIPTQFQPNRLSIFKMIKVGDAEKEKIEQEIEAKKEALETNLVQQGGNQTELKVLGLGPGNDVLFQYLNPSQNIDQTFGVNLKYYKGFKKQEYPNKSDADLTDEERTLHGMPEGVYTFKTQLDQQLPLQYSAIDGANVVYQQG